MSDRSATMNAPTQTTPLRPGWPEAIVAVLVSAVLTIVGMTASILIPDNAVLLRGHRDFLVAGLAPLIGFAAAVSLRIRDLRPFGFRRVAPRWILVGVGVALACFLLSWPVSAAFDPLFPAENIQTTYQDAAMASATSLALTVLFGGVLTPLGEEAVFRGVLLNFLGRWGSWVAVPLSAAIFALAHGINNVLPMAFLVGICAGLLLTVTRSIWPAIVVHMVYNSAGMLYHGLAS